MSGKRHRGCRECFSSPEESGDFMPFNVRRANMGVRNGKR